MERKIGEIFEYNGEWYQCITGNDCENCVFNEMECSAIVCCANGRKDNKDVIFKKLEKVGEQFLYKGKQMQSYIRATDELICNWNNNLLLLEHGDSDIIDIEIKQNKEDMGDNDDICPYDELFSPGTVSNTKYLAKEDMEEKKFNLKPFDIKKAREGKPVCTRDGRKARIICFDRDWDMHIVALVSDTLGESVHYYLSNGKVDFDKQNDEDLMMLPEKKEGWINVYKERCYETKEEAISHVAPGTEYIDTIRVEWEE